MGSAFSVATALVGGYDELADEKKTSFSQKLLDEAKAFSITIVCDDAKLANPPFNQVPLDEDRRRVVQQIYQGFDFEALNIAIFGGPGTGKVSLINALLEQKRGVAGAMAAEDEAKVAMQFAHPKINHVRLWYLPDEFGDGEELVEGYFEERCLSAFDALLILTTGKIRPADVYLVKEAAMFSEYGLPTPTAFLRTKIDGALITGVGRVSNAQGWDGDKERISKSIKSALRKQLDEAGLLHVPVFLVSQGGLLEATMVEATTEEYRYVVDEFSFFTFLAEELKKNRYKEEENQNQYKQEEKGVEEEEEEAYE